MACAVCKGAPEDHGPQKTRHAYTEVPGQVMTHEAAEKAKSKNNGSGVQLVAIPPQQSHSTMLDRLVETLLLKGLIDSHDAVYIMLGKPRPEES